jgi:NitT/TauT family transport system substrate-binding protein
MAMGIFRKGGIAALAVAAVIALTGGASAAPQTSFKIAWSTYVGWMPWPYADESGILKKWADKYGIEIKLVQVKNYVESINRYTAGAFDGLVVTNMDCLTIPAAAGTDTTAIILGDYSNGNDAVILKSAGIAPKKKTLADIAGQKVALVRLSVSQYLLSRALETVNLKEADVTLVDTPDADIVAAFGTPDVTALVAWNPQVGEILKNRNAQKVFDSAQTPGEIIDMMAVNTATLEGNPKLAMALTGAWYEVMGIMSRKDAASDAARRQMAKDSGTDLDGFDRQLETTRLYYEPAEAAAWATSPDLVGTMDRVRKLSFDHGLFGEGATSVDAIGIQFPGGRILGDPRNVKLRFSADYMKMAADHKL